MSEPWQGSDDGDIPIINFEEFLSRKDAAPDCWIVAAAPSAEESIRETVARHLPGAKFSSFETVLYTVRDSLQDVETYRAYLIDHWEDFSELYDSLSDRKSQETLVSVIKGRISGQLAYFRQCCAPDQYFPSGIVHLADHEIIADLGAYDGDTLLEFIRRCPKYKAAYCFEPDVNLLPVLKDIQNQQERLGKRVYIIPKGAWNQSAVLEFSSEGTAEGTTRILDVPQDKPSYRIEAVAVDETVKEPISYMKMDIEGSELRALHGAEKQIMRNHPKLAVCVYHKNEDVLEIWNYLRHIVPEYRFYLRHHTVASDETVLYAIPVSENT